MFRPKVPAMPQPTGLVVPSAVVEPSTIAPGVLAPPPATAAPAAFRSANRLTPGTALALVGGGTAVVLVVGAVAIRSILTRR